MPVFRITTTAVGSNVLWILVILFLIDHARFDIIVISITLIAIVCGVWNSVVPT